MTPYQRGNRDACLELASWAAARAAVYEAELARLKAQPGWSRRAIHNGALFAHLVYRSETYADVARHALARAEAIVDDPDAADAARACPRCGTTDHPPRPVCFRPPGASSE